jgi:hypothetical protein
MRRVVRFITVPVAAGVLAGALVGGPAIAEPEGNAVEFKIPEGPANKRWCEP